MKISRFEYQGVGEGGRSASQPPVPLKPEVRRSIGDGGDDQQALVHLIVEHNTIACYVLLLEGYNGDVMRVTLKPIERTTAITAANTQESIELLSQAKTHGSIFSATLTRCQS